MRPHHMLLTVFLWQQGKLERFLELIAKCDRAGHASYFEAAMEKRLKGIVPLWQAFLADTAAHRAEIMRVPGSVVYADRASCEKAFAGKQPWRQTRSASHE